MSKDRKPQTIVLYAELEDNCGQILAKKRIEIPVVLSEPLDDGAVQRLFDEFCKTALPAKLSV
jgi:hypothetical protein